MVGHDGPTTRTYVVPIDKDLDDLLTDEENEEDLQDYTGPGEDCIESEDDEGPRKIHYKPDRNLFCDPFDEPFDTWVSNIDIQ